MADPELPRTFTLCFYGTLRDREILKTIVGQEAFDRLYFGEGTIRGRAEYAKGKVYPVFIENWRARLFNRTAVTIVYNWTPEALAELDRYENGKYSHRLMNVKGYRLMDVEINGGTVKCLMYKAGNELTGTGKRWTLEDYQRHHHAAWLQKTVDDIAASDTTRPPPHPVMSDLFRKNYDRQGRLRVDMN